MKKNSQMTKKHAKIHSMQNVNLFINFSVEEKKGKTLNKIVTAKNKIRYEISELNERLKQKKQTIQKLKDDISKLETARIAVADIESLT